jgi:glutamyl-tRNA synthetase
LRAQGAAGSFLESPAPSPVVTVEEMVEAFRLEDVNSSPAFFDERKLLHFNAEYIRAMSAEEFLGATAKFLEPTFRAVAPLVQERVRTLGEIPSMVDFLFLPEPLIDEKAWAKRVVRGPAAEDILAEALKEYSSCQWEASVLHDVTAAIGERHGLNLAKAHFPVRVAVTGRDVGPPLFEALEVLGRERTLERLRIAYERLRGSSRD